MFLTALKALVLLTLQITGRRRVRVGLDTDTTEMVTGPYLSNTLLKRNQTYSINLLTTCQ